MILMFIRASFQIMLIALDICKKRFYSCGQKSWLCTGSLFFLMKQYFVNLLSRY